MKIKIDPARPRPTGEIARSAQGMLASRRSALRCRLGATVCLCKEGIRILVCLLNEGINLVSLSLYEGLRIILIISMSYV